MFTTVDCYLCATPLPLLSVGPDHSDGGLGSGLLQLAVHPPDERLVVVYELIDVLGGVSVARATARQLRDQHCKIFLKKSTLMMGICPP